MHAIATADHVDSTVLGSETAPNQPVLLIGPADRFEESGVDAWLHAHGWPAVRAEAIERATWLACIQRLSIVMVAGDDPAAVLDAIRPVTSSAVVILGRPPTDEVVALLSAGADAVVDPSSGPEEVFARVIALIRRIDDRWEPGVRYLEAGELRVDLWSRHCEKNGANLHLSPTEYALLAFLMRHHNQALTSQTIVRRVWGWPPSDGRNALRIFVNRLRRKLGDDPVNPAYIESIRGTGYRFVGNVAEVGESSPTAGASIGLGPLLETVERFTVGLLTCQTVHEAAEQLIACVDQTGYADALAVFRVQGQMMYLISARHTPQWWLDQVGRGVPLRSSFASAHTVLTGETVAFADLADSGGRFASTVERLSPGDFHAGLFVPVPSGGRVWGHLGLVRRARQPYDATGTSFLRTVAATFGLALERLDREDPAVMSGSPSANKEQS